MNTIMDASGLTVLSSSGLPGEMVMIREDVSFLDNTPLWAVTLLGSLFIWPLSLVMILAVYSSAEKMDWGLVEAARDLGASAPKAFLTITFPLTLPGLLSGVILTFIPSMGLFFIADILGGNKVVLVGSVIQDQLTQARNWPFAAALSVVLMILTSAMIWLYRKVARVKELEGLL